MPDTHSNKASQEEGQFSPFAGCSIFIIAGLIITGMISFFIWSYFQTRDMVEAFTDEAPKVIQTTDITNQQQEQAALKNKLIQFRKSIEAKKKDQLTLTAEELNLAISTFDILKPHRGQLFFHAIKNNHLLAEISFPTKASFKSDGNRYINATLIIEPEIVEGAPFPRITSIKNENGGKIHDQFTQFISETLAKPLYDDTEIGPFFKSFTSIEIKGNTLILSTDPNQASAESSKEKPANITDRLLKGFSIIAVVFLAIVTTIIILSRRKANQS